MSARQLHRGPCCPLAHAVEWHDLEHFSEVRCDAPGCTSVVTDRYGWTSGSSIGVPPGWTRVTSEARCAEGTREGFFTAAPETTVTTCDYCPLHTESAIAAATRAT